MANEAKVAAVERLTQVLQGATSIYLTDFTGMPVEMMSDLRRRCREADVEYRVVKDSLTRLAAKRAGVDEVVEFIGGPVALALGHSDQLAPARVLSEFAREYKLPRLKAAFVEGRVFTEEGVKSLAVLPSREVLLGQLVIGMRAPLIGFGGVLRQLMWKTVATLHAVAESIEKTAAPERGGAAPAEAPVDAQDAARAAETAEVGGDEGGAAETAKADAGDEAGSAEAAKGPEGNAGGDTGGPEAGGSSEGGGEEAESPTDKE